MQALNALSESQLTEFVSHSMDFIQSGNVEYAEKQYNAFARALGGSAQNKSIRAAVLEVTRVISDALKVAMSAEQVSKAFYDAGLEAEKAKLVAGMWDRRSKDLALAKVGELVRMNKIEDLTWKFGG